MANHPPPLAAPDLARFVASNPIFAASGVEAFATFHAGGSRRVYAAGAAIVQQDEASDSAFLILEGEAEVFVETPYGAVPVARLGPAQLFGEIGALAAMPRTATVRARTETVVLRLEREHLLALGRRHPELLVAVIGSLGERLATIGRAVGFYTQALAALERPDFDPAILDELLHPVPELLSFAHAFRRMAEQIIERRRHYQEMASAAAIQRAMLPRADGIADPRVALAATLRPAREVGGDFYNYFLLDADRLALVIGDVSGKGVPAALFMAMTQTVLRIALRHVGELGEALQRANALLAADNQETMFATLFCGVLDLRSGALAYANCGHNPPLLLRGGTLEPLPPSAPALAILESARIGVRIVMLAPGDRLLLYTDGVTEATNEAQELFGDKRLEAQCRRFGAAAPRDMLAAVTAAVDDFVAAAPQFDDITLLALAYRDPPPA